MNGWRMRTAGMAATLVVGLLVHAGTPPWNSPATTLAAGLPTVRVDADHDGIDDNAEQVLAERFAPLLFIEPDESNYPVNVDWFLQQAHLQYHEDCFPTDTDDDVGPNPIMTQDQLLGPSPGVYWSHDADCGQNDTGYSHPPHRTLTTIATDPDGQVSAGAATTGYSDQQTFVMPDLPGNLHVGLTDPSGWKTYYHAYPTNDGGIMLQYWHVFAYNHLAVIGFGDHGGDWDASIQVQLDASLQVKQVWFSRHSHDHPGDVFSASQVTFYGTHPLMTIDGGGHAAYASPDDFCNSQSIVGGTAVWPNPGTDPSDPHNLLNITCDPTGLEDNGLRGIVWETWTGGTVTATGSLTNNLTPAGNWDSDGVFHSQHAGMINLGEYNPCTPTTCNGSAQASPLLAGQFYPLNGQVFIQYEGRWGSLPTCGGACANPPRGPVFQGFVDNGEGNVSVYTAWYNQGANTPASPATSPWAAPPTTTLSFTGPLYTANGTTYLSSATTATLTTQQNAIAASLGSAHSFERVYPSGGTPPDYAQYTAPFPVLGPDGLYTINYYSLDGLNNTDLADPQNPPATSVTLDTTPPHVVITQPTATQYTHDQTLTLGYTVDDGTGSGVASITPTMDGATTLAGHGLASGQTINLLSEMTLGTHTFTVTSTDNVANSTGQSVTFTITVTADSIIQDVNTFYAAGKITQDKAHSLLAKLQAAKKARAAGDCTRAAAIYRAFISEVQAQSGKHIDPTAASIMVADAQYLIAHCP
jgi:FIMAH domain-containing protein